MDENDTQQPEDLISSELSDDPLLRLAGSGKHVWADEPADDYVNRLRGAWQDLTADS